MNKIHRTVWSETRQAYVVAHEHAATRGKPSSTRKAVVSAVAAALLAMGSVSALAQTSYDINSGNSLSSSLDLHNGDSLNVQTVGSILANSGAAAVTSLDGGASISGIDNAGTIEGSGGSTNGIYLQGGTIDHILNSAMITGQNAIRISSGTITHAISNSGSIVGTSQRGIAITASTIGSITNSGHIDGDYAIELTTTTVSGDVLNHATGRIHGEGGTGITMTSSSVLGSVINQGTITGSLFGISLLSANIAGGITNSGTNSIIRGSNGIYLGGVSSAYTTADPSPAMTSVSGAIHNSGLIEGTSGHGIFLDGAGVWSIINDAGATIQGSIDGIHIGSRDWTYYTGASSPTGSGTFRSTVTGGISNSGMIIGVTGNGVTINSSTVGGNIDNAGTITAGVDGVRVMDSVVDGTISNSGLISAGATGLAIVRSTIGSTASGSIINSGRIDVTLGSEDAVFVSSSTVNGGITNSGTLSTTHHGIHIQSSFIDGAIVNAAAGRILAGDTAILIKNSATVTGGITNAGTINAGNGILATGSSLITGSIINSAAGVIDANSGDYGIGVWNSASVTGSVVNHGQIKNAAAGIWIGGGTVDVDVINSSTGVMTGVSTGILLTSSASVGSITNAGQINATSVGIKVSNSNVSGKILNSGTISAALTGILLSQASIGTGITNSGTIRVNATGSSAYAWGMDIASGSVVSGGITNTGSILASASTSGFVETAYGIFINSATVNGGIHNNGGTISAVAAGGTAISVYGSGSLLSGGITNSGLISGSAAISVSSGNDMSGGIRNLSGGRIVGTGGVAIALSVPTSNDIDNDSGATINGAIFANNFSNTSVPINVNNNGLWSMPEDPMSPDTYLGSAISGDFIQGSTGTLRIGAYGTGSGEYSTLSVDGSAALAGTLYVDVKSTNALGGGSTLNDVITATGGVTGTFASVDDNSALFNFTAIYNPNDVDLTIAAASSTGVLTAVINTGNKPATGAATALDTIIGGDPTGPIATLLQGLSTDQEVSNAVSQTLPLLVGGSQIAGRAVLSGMNRVIQARNEFNHGLSAGDSFYGDKQFWMKPFGSWADQNDHDRVAGYTARTGGAVFGADAVISDSTRLGIAFAYAKANVDGSSSIAPNSANIDAYQLIGYGSHSLDEDTEINFQAGLGQNKNDGQRRILFAGTTAKSSYDSLVATAGIGLGHTYKLSEQTRFTPSIRADYNWIKDKAYTETGAGALNLDVKGRSTDQLILGLDGKLAHEISKGTTLTANLGVGYDALNKQASLTAAYVGAPGVTFVTKGLDQSPWLLRGGVGLVSTTQSGMEITARYDAEYRQDFLNQTASVKLRWGF